MSPSAEVNGSSQTQLYFPAGSQSLGRSSSLSNPSLPTEYHSSSQSTGSRSISNSEASATHQQLNHGAVALQFAPYGSVQGFGNGNNLAQQGYSLPTQASNITNDLRPNIPGFNDDDIVSATHQAGLASQHESNINFAQAPSPNPWESR